MKYISRLAALFCLFVFNVQAVKVAIVIDDIGYKLSDKKLLELDAPLTYAVLPHTPLGFEYAQAASEKNRDVIIHMPMQAHTHNRLLGPGALYHQMTKSEYQHTLLSALENIPFAIGVNNHMGSLLTQLEQPMSWTMELLQRHNMFFLDSRTTAYSRVSKVAAKYGVMTLNRNIFLDHDPNPTAIKQQIDRLIGVAQQQGSAIAIAHPYKETYQVLHRELDNFKKQGIQIVPLSDLLPAQYYALVKVEPKPAIELGIVRKQPLAQ